MLVVAAIDVGASDQLSDYWSGLKRAPLILSGGLEPPGYSGTYLAVILFARLTMFGMFMSILVKRYGRR